MLGLLSLFVAPIKAQTICPVNTVLESTIDEWDWTQPLYTLYYKIDGTNVTNVNVISPFYDLTNNGEPNVEYLQTVPPDFALEDGWELLYRNFGGPIPGTSGVEFVDAPSFALYNRYSGKVRVMVYHPSDNSSSFDVMEVRAANRDAENESAFIYGSALFSYLETPSAALDQFAAFGNGASAFNRYVDGGVWATLDYVVAYDPCVCEYPSRIYVESVLRDSQAINLQLTGTALTEPQVQAGTPANTLQQGYKLAANGFGAFGAGLTSFNKLDGYYEKIRDWKEASENGTANSPRPTLNVLGEVLPAWFSLGEKVVSVLKFLTGSKGMASAPRITGYSTTFNLQGNGSIVNEDVANPSSYNTPSSEAQNGVQYSDGSDPVYGNPLGVFNLVTTPELRYRVNNQSGATNRAYDWYYSFDGNDLDYVVNTSAGFEPVPRRLMLALVYEGCPYEVRTMRLLDQRVGGDFRTPFVDAACFENQFVNFYADWLGGGGDGTIGGGGDIKEPIRVTDFREYNCLGEVYLQVLATLIPTNGGDDVVFMGSYRVNIGAAESINAALPFGGFFSDEAAARACTAPVVPPISVEALTQFCHDIYNPRTTKSGTPPTIIKEIKEAANLSTASISNVQATSVVFPNPFVDQISIQAQGEPLEKIILFDLMGRVVFQRDHLALDSPFSPLRLNLADLPQGHYQLQLVYKNRVAASTITKTSN
ncbi:T9SS type A sorting domain-containing protein [Neolewinella lacunae]|uniref:T9SS type A sorting domain-containing protein n=1 Tax=Neolewinella lacunae TaxID=1517758 RepID=A0A923PJ13_9BACT|nr:T9SS type A sorting domain-containing protein [Neolewinella lacunae]MBC6993591.1 T9SS type A sorting domain-containing protein [Neolewinella lacunae]MDN3633477.1 T9SS type A sorting domain-containing protein [Neolewinella lacunae]